LTTVLSPNRLVMPRTSMTASAEASGVMVTA
jgi:hypothetical protein